MTDHSTFELHTFPTNESDEDFSLLDLPWQDDEPRHADVIGIGGDRVMVGMDASTKCPVAVETNDDAIASFQIVKRKLNHSLAMTAYREGVLVNGLPALSLTVLSPKDAIVIAPGVHTYVTQRIKPHIGSPTKEMLGKKCPSCRIPIDKETTVVTCRCGVVYHNETEESHGDLEEKDRLNCLSKIKVCLSCGRTISISESLVWDPATL